MEEEHIAGSDIDSVEDIDCCEYGGCSEDESVGDGDDSEDEHSTPEEIR